MPHLSASISILMIYVTDTPCSLHNVSDFVPVLVALSVLSFLYSKPCISLKIDKICSKQHALEGLAWTAVMRDVEIPLYMIL